MSPALSGAELFGRGFAAAEEGANRVRRDQRRGRPRARRRRRAWARRRSAPRGRRALRVDRTPVRRRRSCPPRRSRPAAPRRRQTRPSLPQARGPANPRTTRSCAGAPKRGASRLEPKSPASMVRPVAASARSIRTGLPATVGFGQSSTLSAVSALPGATMSAVAAGCGDRGRARDRRGGGAPPAAAACGGAAAAPGNGSNELATAIATRLSSAACAERRIGEGEAAQRRVRRRVLVEAGIEHRRPVLARDDEEGVRLDRLVDDLAGRAARPTGARRGRRGQRRRSRRNRALRPRARL